MRKSNLQVTPLILSLMMTASAFGQPPDQIPHSLIPPLKEEQPARTAGRVARLARGTDAAAAEQTPTYDGTAAPYSEVPVPSNNYDTRLAIWNSPEMVDARQYVLEYSQRSARSSLKEGQQFLTQLSRLSPDEMTNWLERLQSRRAAITRQQEVTSAARQFIVEREAQRLENARQVQANIDLWQSLNDIYLQEQLQSQQLSPREQRWLREASRTEAIASQRALFDPLAPTFDPASPSRRTRAYAAAALPGDLPRGDPGNFSRGDEGNSTGGSGVGQNGGAVAAPAPAPAPAPAGAAEAATASASGE